MKWICFTALAGLLFFAFRPAPGFHITGQVTGGPGGTLVYLKYADIPEKKMLDSTTLHNGRFTFSGRVSSPRFYTIFFKTATPDRPADNRIINLFVENADISVQAPYDSLLKEYEAYGSSGISPAVAVKGSASHNSFLRYEKGQRPLDKRKSDLFNDYIGYLNPDKGAAKLPREYGMGLCRKMDITDSSRKAYLMQYIKSNPPGEIEGYIALQGLQMGNITTTDVDQLVQRFARVKDKGVLVTKFLEEAPLARKIVVGSSLVDFSMEDTSGTVHRLSDYIGKGKYVLLECWASWCHPCRADIPHLKEVYGLYHPYGFDVISVSLDDKKENWTKAIGEEKMAWLQLSDLHAFAGILPTTYHINGIPACLLFDPQGKLVTRNMRGAWMDSRLIKMYGNHFPAS